MLVYQTRTPLLAALALLLASCGAEPVKCARVGGFYEPLYTPVQGTCGPIANPYKVPFDGGISGVNMDIRMFSNARVTTEIVMKGCSLRMTQTVDVNGAVQSKIDGETINIHNAEELTGTVTMTRWDNGQVACSGTYDARFTKNSVTIGGAAQ
jgi:hypothetical protein